MIYSICISCSRDHTTRPLYQVSINGSLPTNTEGKGEITLCDFCKSEFERMYVLRSVFNNTGTTPFLNTDVVRQKTLTKIVQIIEEWPGTQPPSYRAIAQSLEMLGMCTIRGGVWTTQNLQQFIERNRVDKNSLFYVSRQKLIAIEDEENIEEITPVITALPVTNVI